MALRDKFRRGIQGGLAALVMGASLGTPAFSQEVTRRAIPIAESLTQKEIPKAILVDDEPRVITVYHILDHHGLPVPWADYMYINDYQKKVYDVVKHLHSQGFSDFYNEAVYDDFKIDETIVRHHRVATAREEAAIYARRGDAKNLALLNAQTKQLSAKYEKQFPYLRGGLLQYALDNKLTLLPTERQFELADMQNATGVKLENVYDWIGFHELREFDVLSQIAQIARTDAVILVFGKGHSFADAYAAQGLGDRYSTMNNVVIWNNHVRGVSDNSKLMGKVVIPPVLFEFKEIDPLTYKFDLPKR
jgi:hypothetical protein